MSPKLKRSQPDATKGRDAGADSHPSVPPAVAAATYFVTGPNLRVARAVGGVAAAVSGGPFHAKTMGTPFTACGLPASSWTKLWDIPFAQSPRPVCAHCFDIVNGTVPGPR
jgi:hypothetical protein